MKSASSGPLPEYENPPVIEVVCGVLFRPIEGFMAPHLGLLWELYKPDYPRCKEVPPLAPVIELFDKPPTVKLELAELPPLPRIWFEHATGNEIIQVQRDRFHYNWRKVRSEDEYPRYPQVLHAFEQRLSTFVNFVSDSELALITPIQYELSYINHIPRGDGWNALLDIGNVFPDFAWRARHGRLLSDFEDINWRTKFELPEQQGRLHVAIRYATRQDDNRPVLLFELTARGIGKDQSLKKSREWFDLAREWIVRGFTDLTGEALQKDVWRRIR